MSLWRWACGCSWVVLLLVQQAQARQKRRRIWVELCPCLFTCSTALIRWTTRRWLISSRVWLKWVLGVASMNSIEFRLKCFLWLPRKWKPSKITSSDMPTQWTERLNTNGCLPVCLLWKSVNSCSKAMWSPSFLPVASSSPWTLAMLVEQSCLRT